MNSSMIMLDQSGSMNSVIGDMHGRPNWTSMLQKAWAGVPHPGKRYQMIIITDGETQQQSFPKPKYEKFSSTEDMIEEKLLTGRGRRSNKEIAAVRREARKLNKKLKLHLKMRMKNVQSVQTFKV